MENKRLVRFRGGFSDRNNINPLSKTMQFTEFSKETRICIWNILYEYINRYLEQYNSNREAKEALCNVFASELLNLPIDEHNSYERVVGLIKEIIMDYSYDQVLDVIEFVGKCIPIKDKNLANYGFNYNEYYQSPKRMTPEDMFNPLFEQEYIGYRFINDQIVSITNESEIAEIKNSLNTPYEKVNGFMEKALSFLSEKEKDFKNSIKESVSALECLCSTLSGENGTLGSLVSKLEQTYCIHPALTESIKKLYGFASDESGVRHGNNGAIHNVTFAEANLVLIICSGLINYFVSITKNSPKD